MSKTEFLVGYGRVVARSWEDAEYVNRLVNEPHAVLSEAGISVPASANVVVQQIQPTQGTDPDAYADRWLAGEQTGTFDPEDAALSDELLAAVSGGVAGESAAGCCCCCPCCCCGSIEAAH
jgi:hypothetical protein